MHAINITPEGKFYFSPVDNFKERSQLLDIMGKKYSMTFSDEEKIAFFKTQAFGVPMNQLKRILENV